MDIIYSFFSGIIQGLTEFLPVSSSGHLVLLHDIANFKLKDEVAFDVMLHLGTLTALIAFFYRDLYRYAVAWLQSIFRVQSRSKSDSKVAWYLFFGTIPAAIVGYFFEEQIVDYFRNPIIVAGMLIAVGLLLGIVDKYGKKTKHISELTFTNAAVIGFFQVLALIPGTSRSGITIIAGLTQKLNRHEAAKFSFLLSTPVIFGAGIKKMYDLFSQNLMLSEQVTIMAIGFVTSAIVGYACIKYFLKFLERYSLTVFMYYRILLGIIIIVLVSIRG